MMNAAWNVLEEKLFQPVARALTAITTHITVSINTYSNSVCRAKMAPRGISCEGMNGG